MPSAIQTASPAAPAASIPSPEPAGSRSASVTGGVAGGR